MPEISSNMLVALKRQRGEQNLKLSDLSRETGVSRFALYRIFNDNGRTVANKTYNRLNDWLYQKL